MNRGKGAGIMDRLIELMGKQTALISTRMDALSTLLRFLDDSERALKLNTPELRPVADFGEWYRKSDELIAAENDLLMIGTVALLSGVSFDLIGVADRIRNDLKTIRDWGLRVAIEFGATGALRGSMPKASKMPSGRKEKLITDMILRSFWIEGQLKRWPIRRPSAEGLKQSTAQAEAGQTVPMGEMLARLK